MPKLRGEIKQQIKYWIRKNTCQNGQGYKFMGIDKDFNKSIELLLDKVMIKVEEHYRPDQNGERKLD